MNRKIIAAISLLYFFPSCSRIVKTIQGVSDMKQETKTSVTKYFTETLHATGTVYFLNNHNMKHVYRKLSYFSSADTVHISFYLPLAAIFDTKSTLLVDHKIGEGGCYSNFEAILKDTEKLATYPRDSSVTVDPYLKALNIAPKNVLPYQYIVFAFWTKATNRANKTKLTSWLSYNNDTNKLFKVIPVNVDALDSTRPY